MKVKKKHEVIEQAVRHYVIHRLSITNITKREKFVKPKNEGNFM